MSGSSDNCLWSAPPTAEWRARCAALLTAGCRYLLGAVFLTAAVSKVTDAPGFEERLLESTALPAAAAVTVAGILPWLELTCGLCLVLGFAAREAAVCTALLLLAFLVYGFLAPSRPDCGCFLAPLPEPDAGGWWPPLRNAVLLLCSLGVALPKRPR